MQLLFNAEKSSELNLRLGLVGPMVFGVGVIAQDFLKPDFDPIRQFVSHLSLGPGGVFNIGLLIAVGIAIALFGLGLRQIDFPGGRLTPVLVATLGVAFVIGGVFVIDPGLGYPPGLEQTTTWHGQVHDAAGLLAFLSITGAAFSTARKLRDRDDHRHLRRFSYLVAATVPVLFIATSVVVSMDYAGGMDEPIGGFLERSYLAIAMTWLAVLSLAATHVGPVRERAASL